MSDPSPRGTYLVIADVLRRELEEAQPAGDALLSESGIQERFGVARTTARRALTVLAREKLITPVKGIGWKPRDPADTGATPLPERILADLVDAVRREELAVGDPIRSEAELSAAFEASRGRVRQALAVLEGRGIVTAVPGKARRLAALPDPTGDTDGAPD
ncbi:hypothetical protein B4N89_27765 [Embleya scabrispora]|uniref:HTH gntR-type domain-containing protein n=1 Tax=Embleya scabrispora TaxID=159449 RepID=A0A1T3P5R8_9ACTN|nr:GntR family transcriptional regulator [Embleya scabrispora]OPC84220.1 hypothetical protein B4N89_27765 [Embleya scabrispora]